MQTESGLAQVDALLNNGFLENDTLRLKIELTVLDQALGSVFHTLPKEELQVICTWTYYLLIHGHTFDDSG